MAKKKKQNNQNMFYGIIAVAVIVMFMTSQGKVETPQVTQQQAQESGCTNTCASNYNQKTYPDCSCYAATTTTTTQQQQQADQQQPAAQDPAAQDQVVLSCVDSDSTQVNFASQDPNPPVTPKYSFISGFTTGTISGVDAAGQFTVTDYCIDGQTVLEYYCDGTEGKGASYTCDNGCNGGKCNKYDCTDFCTESGWAQGEDMSEATCNSVAPIVLDSFWLILNPPPTPEYKVSTLTNDGCCCHNGDA